MTAHEQVAAEYLTACLSRCMGEGYTCHCEATGEGYTLMAYSEGMVWRKDEPAMPLGLSRRLAWHVLGDMAAHVSIEMGWGW